MRLDWFGLGKQVIFSNLQTYEWNITDQSEMRTRSVLVGDRGNGHFYLWRKSEICSVVHFVHVVVKITEEDTAYLHK